MKLSTRLVLLILGCLLPILTAQIYSQVNLYAERHQQLSALVLRQAELANSDMVSIIDGVHQLGTLAGEFPSVRTAGEPCSSRLTVLRQSLPRYRFLALFSPADGSLICASDGLPVDGSAAHPPWLWRRGITRSTRT